jgi:hypothetical protein
MSVVSAVSEDEPLLARQRSADTIGLPGSHRRRSSARSASHNSELRRDSLSKILEEADESTGKGWLYNSLSVLFVIIVGSGGWAIAWKSGVWTPTPEDVVTPDKEVAFGAEVLGYLSAVAYLG